MSTTDATSPLTGADRASLYRERRAAGCCVVRVEVGPADVEGLVNEGLLGPGESGDRAALGEAIETLLFGLSEGAIKIDLERLIEAINEAE